MDLATTTLAGARADATGRLGFVFGVEFVYLLLLLALALVYVTPLGSLLPFKLPDALGPVPIGVPWFAALGAVLISLSAVFDHRGDWNPEMKYWHFSRPLIGASLGVVSVLIFQAGILAVNAQPRPAGGVANLLYYLIAFLVGYREETCRELIKRLGDVILTPGGGPAPPVVHALSLDSGQIAGGDRVIIHGGGFTGVTEVRFGQGQAKFTVDSDGQITATSPPAAAPGAVIVSVTTKQGTATAGPFMYTLE